MSSCQVIHLVKERHREFGVFMVTVQFFWFHNDAADLTFSFIAVVRIGAVKVVFEVVDTIGVVEGYCYK